MRPGGETPLQEGAEGCAPEATSEVVDGVPRANGDVTWQAQIYVPRPGVVHRPGQKPVFICIRGPSRPDRRDAEEDESKFMSAFREGGVREVRKVRSGLNSDAGRGGWGSGTGSAGT